ncbi:MAG: hypothetical protein ACRD96_03785 [Bryobacteraceae bacterium]
MGPYRRSLLGLLAVAGLVLVSCSSGPQPPKPGTPGFFWLAAKENFKTGDYVKASDQLEQVTKSQNEHTASAWPWRLVLVSALAHVYMDLADQFEDGARVNKVNPTPLRRRVSDFRSLAARNALVFAEAVDRFAKEHKDGEVTLDFPFPTGSPAPVAALKRVREGAPLPGPEMESAQRSAVQRAVLLETCRAVGAANDTAKAQELLKSPPAKIPRDVFVRAMAESMYEIAAVFGQRKADQPERQTLFLTRAQDLAAKLADSKESKDLKSKIEAELKKSKTRKP